MNSLYITRLHNDIIIAYRSNEKLTEIMVENDENQSIVGNIYKAKVIAISAGLNAAFVDYGEKKKGFLPLNSADGKISFNLGNEIDEVVQSERVIHVDDEILVQIERDEISTKGARLTSYITIPGNFMVFMPDIHFVGVSKKVMDRKFRSEIKKYMYTFIEQDMGVIIRTAAYDASKPRIKKEYKELVNMWKHVIKKTDKIETPALLYKESSFIIKTVRDILKKGLDEIVIDSKDIYNDIMRYFSFVNPRMKKKVQLYQFTVPMLSYYDIDKEMEQIFNPNVYLKHGAYIIIEQTEALTTIDVNSGRMSKSADKNNLITTINLMAAEEIAKQLRLRDIGGIIVVDFIDMKDEFSRRKVVSEFKKHLKSDRSTTKVHKISRLGLVEMTRKRVGPSMVDHFVEECEHCKSRGYTPKPVYTALKFLRWVKDNGKNFRKDTLIINASTGIINEIENNLSNYLIDIMRDWQVNIKIEENNNIRKGFLEIYSRNRLERIATIN